MTTTDHDLANAQTHINLLEAQVAAIQAQLTAHADVISAARSATAWWFNDVYERYPTLQAPWVGPLNLALRRLDRDSQT